MEALSDDANEDTGNPIMKPKTRSPAQVESFKKAQATRIENAKAKKEKLENIKETIKIDRTLSVEEKEESGLAKLQREREEIEKKILAQGKMVAEKKKSEAALKQTKKEEIKEKEQLRSEVKKVKKEPKVIYQDASESEEEVIIVKKKKKQPKVVYESESEEEAPPPKPKTKHAPVPVSEKQPQIIKTNQIRFF
jgi:chromosome segregation ATPase